MKLDALIPYARNARTHSEEQVAQIAGSIREFGFTNPVLIDGEGGIIAGHGRVMAARKLGLDDVPCIRLGHLNEAQKRAYIIADNKLALNAGWDANMLSVEFADLLAMGADLVFSCPPYADLEVYSDDPADLSNMDYADFLAAYREIIARACSLLKNDRFAVFVVGDVRDKKGNYRNFVGDTVEAFRAAGLEFYNEAILVTPCGSVALRAGRTFSASRKLGKAHQNVLVFVKGDGKKAAQACGIVETDDSMFDAVAVDAE